MAVPAVQGGPGGLASFRLSLERVPATYAWCPRAVALQAVGLSCSCAGACVGVRPSGHVGGGRRELCGAPIAAGALCPAHRTEGAELYLGSGFGVGAGHRGPAAPGSPRGRSRAGHGGGGRPAGRGCGLYPSWRGLGFRRNAPRTGAHNTAQGSGKAGGMLCGHVCQGSHGRGRGGRRVGPVGERDRW